MEEEKPERTSLKALINRNGTLTDEEYKTIKEIYSRRKKNPPWRPTKYEPWMDEAIIEYVGEQGHSFESFCAKIKVPLATVRQWTKRNESFHTAYYLAKDMRLGYAHDKLQFEDSFDKEINTPLRKLWYHTIGIRDTEEKLEEKSQEAPVHLSKEQFDAILTRVLDKSKSEF